MSHRLATFSVAFLLWALSGCSQLTVRAGGGESDVASVVPGMTRDQVVARLGQPTWTFGVWQEHLTILNYRFSHSACTIYQISVRPDGTVRDVSPAPDPACDNPD